MLSTPAHAGPAGMTGMAGMADSDIRMLFK
jgi:hypothetical protein